LGTVVSGSGENSQGDTDRGRHSRHIGAAYASSRAFSRRGKVGKAAGVAGIAMIIGNEILNYKKKENERKAAEENRKVREYIKYLERIKVCEKIEVFLRKRFGNLRKEIPDQPSLNHDVPITIDNK
jgi:hypothetical protein